MTMPIRCQCAKPEIAFCDVYATPNSYQTLYELLRERTKEQSISHVNVPTMAEHIAFVRSKPYTAWYLIDATAPIAQFRIGAIYLTRAREVGIFVFRQWMGHGYGSAALALLRHIHPGCILANVNPENKQSQAFFFKHGGRVISHTFALD